MLLYTCIAFLKFVNLRISLKLSLKFDRKVQSCIAAAKFCEDLMIQR